MKKRGSKLRKILLRTLLILVFFSSVVAVLTRNKYVQTRIAQSVTNYLSSELKAKVSIKAVEIDFLRNFHFEDFLIQDRHGDTLFFASTFNFRIAHFSYRKQKIDIRAVELNQLVIHIGDYAGEKGMNFDFISDYFSSPAPEEKTKPWFFEASNIKIRNAEFLQFYYKNGPIVNVPNEYNNDYLMVRDIDIDIPKWTMDDIHGNRFRIEHLKAKERSGLELVELVADCEINGKHILLDHMKLRTPNCIIGPRFEMINKNDSAYDRPFHDVIYDLKLKNSKLCMHDFRMFSDWLANRTFCFDVNAEVRGPLSNLRAKYFHAVSGNGTNLKLKYGLIGLPNVPQLLNSFEFDRSVIAMSDLQEIMPELDLPKTVVGVGLVNLNGKLDVPMGSLSWDGDIKTDMGHMNGLMELDYANEKLPLKYMLNVNIDSVNWLHFLPQASFLGKANMGVYVKGSGFDEHASLEYDITTSSYTLNKRKFKKASVDGRLDNGKLSGFFNSEDPSALLTASVEGENIFKNQVSTIEMKVQNLDFEKLGFDSVHTAFKGSIEIATSGNDLNSILGDITFRNCVFNRDDEEFVLPLQVIRRDIPELVSFSGNWIDGNIKGNWKLAKTGLWFEQIMHEMIPARFEKPLEASKDSVHFDLFLLQTVWLDALIAPGLRLGPVSLRGYYHGASNKYSVDMGPFSIEYGLFYGEKTKINIRKDMSLGLPTQITFNTNNARFDKTLYDKVNVYWACGSDIYMLNSEIKEVENKYSLKMNGTGQIFKEIADFHFTSTELKIFKNKWLLEKSAKIQFLQDKTQISNFYLSDNEHYLEVNGNISDSKLDTVRIDFSNITPSVLAPFFPKGALDSIEFRGNGDVKICAVLKNPKFLGDLSLNKFKFNGFLYGDLDVALKATDKIGQLQMTSLFRSGPLKGLAINGGLQLTQSDNMELDLYGELPRKTSLKILDPFLKGILDFRDGTVRGNFHVFGTTDVPKAEGLLSVEQGRVKVDYLATEYTFAGNIKVTEKGLFSVRPIKVFDDSKKSFAWMKLAFTYKNFSDFALDVQFDSLKNFKVLQTTEKENSLFYGTAWADGNCRIYGPIDKINMDINLKPRKNSVLAIQYLSANENKIYGSITFRNHLGKIQNKGVVQKEEPSSLGKIQMNITATPDAEVQFIIDKKLGDIIKGRGNGQLRMVYDVDGKFYLFGAYTVEQGEYSFSLPGINLLKKISLDKGGSIVWDGDPFNAVVDLVGRVEKKISPSTLMITSSSASSSYPATKIISILNLKGNLFSPQIGFDIQAPELATTSGTAATEVNSIIQRIRTDKDETMRQAVALLLFGNFIPPSFSSSGASAASNFSGTGFAGNSVSTIASSVVNDLFSKYGIPTRIQVNIDDVRSSTGTSNTKLFVNSEWFLSDRLRLDLNYDPTVAVLVSSMAVPINFNLEYKTSDENWRLKAFSRSSNLLLSNGLTNGVSGNTLGAGILYRREFETFRRKKPKVNQK